MGKRNVCYQATPGPEIHSGALDRNSQKRAWTRSCNKLDSGCREKELVSFFSFFQEKRFFIIVGEEARKRKKREGTGQLLRVEFGHQMRWHTPYSQYLRAKGRASLVYVSSSRPA